MMTITGVTLKPIPIAPNEDYMAGDDGNIYSRTRYAGCGKKGYVEWYALVGCKGGGGYRIVSLCHQNKKRTARIHRLICMAFHGLPPKKSSQVRHLDGNKENNRPGNLMWGNQYENWMDRKKHNKPYVNSTYKFTPEEREKIRWAIKSNLCSQRHAANILGVSQSSIFEIVSSERDHMLGSRKPT